MSFAIIAISSSAVALVGAGVSAYGALYSGAAQANAAKFNSEVAANNASAAAQQTHFDAQTIADRGRRTVAIQRAAMASSGFDTNTGSFSDVTSDTKRQVERDRLARVYQGRLGVNASTSQSMLFGMESSNARTASYIGAASSILGGIGQATNIAGQDAMYNSNPGFN